MKPAWALIAAGMSIALAGCAAPMAMDDIAAVRPDCGRVDRQIAALEQEKAQNDKRVLAGVASVAPALAVLNVVQGTYGTNAAIATGQWARAIDAKLAELRRARAACGKPRGA